jgi:SAM-dependent methyltransferase
MGVVRHLAGDQAASWAYHIDHWFAERFEHTLGLLGFGNIKVNNSSWKVEPFLSNVEVIAEKTSELSIEEMLLSADKILWESTVSDREKKVYEVWREQLRDVLKGSNNEKLGIAGICNIKETISCSKTIENNILQNNSIPLSEIHDFNQMNRNKWVIEKAKTISAGSKVLDVGAGTCPYKYLFNHCDYKTHDFKKYEGVKLNGEQDYGKIDYVSDIVNIPIEDNSFDVVLCTEVLEHVPEPIKALEEMSRLLKPGGRLLITAPLGSGLHQLPYHYYVAEDGEVVLARTVGADGKSGARIGGQLATASTLASLGARLVELHGQHQTSGLLDAATQTAFLDRFAGAAHEADVTSCAEAARARARARSALAELESAARDRERERDLLAYQVREIEAVGPAVEETETLQAEEARLGHVERLLELAGAAEVLVGGEDAVAEGAAAAARLLESVARA